MRVLNNECIEKSQEKFYEEYLNLKKSNRFLSRIIPVESSITNEKLKNNHKFITTSFIDSNITKHTKYGRRIRKKFR
ncbi:hypothetical protein Indivirus_1_133 [Indivirus ILV1]|uniref:Uncharacterized protein n=1 Tax=Indivirus ILV1 TaxID=1977633 RepID=A0A1V0SCQ8_9VIRU|nr:hypothetical protein Indivirus_1_133 [Indivirus ILV1]